MPPLPNATGEDDAAENAARRRAVTAALAGLGLLVVFGALACAGARGPVHDRAVQRWGDYAADDAISEDGVYAQGLVMSRDAIGGGILVSYEYFHNGELFVGYQRVSEEPSGALAMGDEVDVTLSASSPTHARIEGTRRAPEAERTRAVDRWLDVTSRLQWPALFLACVLLLWASIRQLGPRDGVPARPDDS